MSRRVLEFGPTGRNRQPDGFGWLGVPQWLLVGGSLLAAVGCTGSPAGPVDPLPPLTVATTAPEAGRDPFLWPFASESPWNLPIGSDAEFSLAGDTATLTLRDPSVGIWLNADEWSHPIVTTSPDDPVLLVDYATRSFAPFEAGTVEVRIPTSAQPAVGVDAHLHVIDLDGFTAHEFFQLQLSGGRGSATYYALNDLRSNGIDSGGTRAYGGSALGGLIRTWEFEQGEIRHALAVALNGVQLRRGPVWPATEEDASAEETYRGSLPMGTLIAIPPTVDVESLFLSDAGLVLARALQDFGGYVVDQSTDVTFYAEPSVPQETIDEVRGDLERIRRELRVVTNNSLRTPGGGGEPTVPVAPPLVVS